jgi:hypothetical protein
MQILLRSRFTEDKTAVWRQHEFLFFSLMATTNELSELNLTTNFLWNIFYALVIINTAAVGIFWVHIRHIYSIQNLRPINVLYNY